MIISSTYPILTLDTFIQTPLNVKLQRGNFQKIAVYVYLLEANYSDKTETVMDQLCYFYIFKYHLCLLNNNWWLLKIMVPLKARY